MKPTALAVLLATTILTACSVSSTSGGTKPKEMSSGLFGMSTAEEVKVDTAAAFKGQSRLVIGGFKVGFIEEKKESQKAGSGFGGKSSAHLKMNGITAAHMQQITDAAYADFVAKLKAAGYTVDDRTALISHEDFKDVKADASPLREEASFFGSSNTVTYVAPTALGKLYWVGDATRTGGFGFANAGVGAAMVADKTKVPVIFVNYLVDFANSDGSGGRWSTTSTLQVGQGVSVPPNMGLWWMGGQGGTFSSNNGSISFGQPVYSTETFGDVVNTSTDAAVGVETALNVATALLGGGTNQSRSFEINADPARYSAVAGKVLADANTKLLNKAASLR